ncbi:MAG: hypothetical protein AB1349_11815 [Elusimicrobiota bacterium]
MIGLLKKSRRTQKKIYKVILCEFKKTKTIKCVLKKLKYVKKKIVLLRNRIFVEMDWILRRKNILDLRL